MADFRVQKTRCPLWETGLSVIKVSVSEQTLNS